GTLKAVAYEDGNPVASEEVRTAGPAACVRQSPDRKMIQADGYDCAFDTGRIAVKNGNLATIYYDHVHPAPTGAANIAAVDNGNAATVEPFHADQRRAFNGLALLILRSRPGQAGQIQVSATSDGLTQGETQISAVAAGRNSVSK